MHDNHCICRKFHWLGNLMLYFSDNLVLIVQFFMFNIALFFGNPDITITITIYYSHVYISVIQTFTMQET